MSNKKVPAPPPPQPRPPRPLREERISGDRSRSTFGDGKDSTVYFTPPPPAPPRPPK